MPGREKGHGAMHDMAFCRIWLGSDLDCRERALDAASDLLGF